MLWLRSKITFLALVCLFILNSCGFRPLYLQSSNFSNDVLSHLATIQVDPIADRAGQQLRNMLEGKLKLNRPQTPNRYGLSVNLKETRTNLVILKDASSTFARLRMDAVYKLYDIQSNNPLSQGQSESTTIFNLVESEFANINAQADARKRAVTQISDDIQLKLGLFFHRLVYNR